MRFPISVYFSYFEDLSAEQTVEFLTQAGFTHGELSEDHLHAMLQQDDPVKEAREFGKFAADHGMAITQGHLSFEKGLWICSDDTVEKLKPELEMFAAIGIKNAVLHASGGEKLEPELRYARAAENVGKVAQFAEGLGITICLENLMSVEYLRTADSLLGLIKAAGDRNLGICLDTGHLHLCNKQGWARQTQGEFIRTAGKYLKALHIVDNDGLGDTHQMPFSARYGVDWTDVVTALREVDYPGIFNVECLGEHYAPVTVRRLKLDYIHKMCTYMLSDEFLKDDYLRP